MASLLDKEKDEKASFASTRSQSTSTGNSRGTASPFNVSRGLRQIWDDAAAADAVRGLQQPSGARKGGRRRGEWIEGVFDDDEALEFAARRAIASATAGSGTLRYTRMPMRAFLSHKDWRELITKGNSGKLAKSKNSGNKYNRMLYSYHKLYQEYQYLCTRLLPRSKMELHSGSSEDGGVREDAEDTNGIGSDVCEAESFIDGEAEVPNDQPSFDSVLMSGRNFKIQCCKKRRSVVCHQVFTRVANGTTVWLDVPLAVELLLPRLQEQIKAVMSACPHVPDPLEVLAELRANRYDTERCIGYLRETMPLREAVRDILAVQFGRRLNVAKSATATGADRRELRCRIAGLESQLREATALLLRKDGHGDGFGSAAVSGGSSDPLLNRVRHLLVSLDAVKALLDTEESPPCQQRQGQQKVQREPQELKPLGNRSKQKPLQPPLPAATPESGRTPPTNDAGGGRSLLRGFHQLRDDLRIVRTSLHSIATAMSAGLTKIRSRLTTQYERHHRSADDGVQQQATVARLQKYIEELRIKCKEEESRRRLEFNTLQEQLGNIRVYCRCTRIEGDQAVETVGAESVRVRGQQQDEVFRFDRVFRPDVPQESLFEELQPLITSFLDGYNVCFITYGGEASGKTFTLLGNTKQRGLVYRALQSVLKEAASRAADWHMELDSVCLEIYNDACFDLLADRTAVSCYPDCGLSSVFAALQQTPIRQESDVLDLLRVSGLRRRVAKTALNPKSSRSHLIYLLRLRAKSRVHGHTACSYLGMMDLAGAENIVKADTWREPDRSAEAGHINRSLAAFNRLFLTLRRMPPSAACYRESRLTQMLKPFLVNHGKCCIVITVRTDQGSVSTTMSTLRFGKDARQVSLGKAQRQLVTIADFSPGSYSKH